MTNFYSLVSPTEWTKPPQIWSSSKLDDVEVCPRRWQLRLSSWGEYEYFPTRSHPAAIEGQIIHDALDRLARACGLRGLPAFGSQNFQEALHDANFFSGIQLACQKYSDNLAHHPRPGPPFRLRLSPQELANRAVRLFRAQYQPRSSESFQQRSTLSDGSLDLSALLKLKGALSEVRLEHPDLPFVGVLDHVALGDSGVEITDYKTGNASEAHQIQLMRYALLWWRVTGEVPAEVTAQYLNHRQTWPIQQSELVVTEVQLRLRIEELITQLGLRPAPALPGKACKWCAVRARCYDGWSHAEKAARADGRGDVEIIVKSLPGSHGFIGLDMAGAEVSVVHDASISALIPPLEVDQCIRIIDGEWRSQHTEIQIRAWSEIYPVA